MDGQHEPVKAGWSFAWRVPMKAALLFLLVNLLFTLLPPQVFGEVSLYNRIFPGRKRLPFGEDPQHAYNLSLYNLEAMLASHEVSREPSGPEFRVFLVGDSSVWGTLLRPEETLAGQVDAAGLVTCAGEPVKAYNLGYPTLSLFKDLTILDQTQQYEPDLVIWLLTLESFPRQNQLSTPLVANNPQLSSRLISQYNLPMQDYMDTLVEPGFWERSLVGRRRALADLYRLQLLGFMWGATGIDQVYPADYAPALRDLERDESYTGRLPGDDLDLALEMLEAGRKAAGKAPVWYVNEPILVSTGQNSDVRYNYYYPRWAYDAYRMALSQDMAHRDRVYLDLWDLVPQEEFTNSAIHLTPIGTKLLVQQLIGLLAEHTCLR